MALWLRAQGIREIVINLHHRGEQIAAELGDGSALGLETIAAVHAGASVLGISLVTNPAAGLAGERLAHEDVLAVAEASAARVGTLLAEIVGRM